MALEHLIVHKSSDDLCAFPDIIRLHNGDLVTVFRESAIHPPSGNPDRPQDAKITHHHVITGSRVALVRSTDDGGTWAPASRIVVDAGNDAQDLNMPLIAQLTLRRADCRQSPLVRELDGGTTGSTAGEAEYSYWLLPCGQ